jgi:quercetin dioxygenase-like cupin family protein
VNRLLIVVALLLCALYSFGTVGEDKEAEHKDRHVILAPDALQWKPNPNLPPGAQSAVLSGDPTKSGGLYAVRIKLPDGYKVPPHWHPVDENVTVIRGTLLIGLGEKADRAKLKEVPAGAFMHMPKQMRHFAMAKGETVLQLHGIGPFEINYVNPDDDPRKK